MGPAKLEGVCVLGCAALQDGLRGATFCIGPVF